MTLTLRLAACFSCAAVLALHAQTLEVSPSHVMVDEPATIRAAGLSPNEHVTVRAELVDGGGAHWVSQADFVADSGGAVDTSKQPAVAGSYNELSSMGLVWSMPPAPRNTARYQQPQAFGAQTITFQLMRGDKQVATAQLQQSAMAVGVQRVPLHDGSLRGMLFLPAGNDRHPGMLVLGGSEGGLPSLRAAWLASHGFAALALAYFRYDDLPKELAGIPLEYFGQALNWLAHRPEVTSDHIGVMGISRGAELALQLGSMYTMVQAVVAYSPANVRYPACCGFTSVPYAWSWKGSGLAFHPLRPTPNQAAMVMKSVIEVEQTHGPVLVISGEDDRVWQSSSMAESVVGRLKRAHFQYNVEHLKYPHAGHAAGRPEIVPAWLGATRNPTSGREVEMGGTPKGNAEPSLDAAPKVIDFLRQSLQAH